MDSSWPEKFSSSASAAGKAIQELIQGHQLAIQLISILGCLDDGSLAAAEDLAARISRSFAETISIVLEEHKPTDENSQIPANSALGGSPWLDGWKSKDSGESCLSSAMENRGGCKKRRRIREIWTKLTPTPVADDYVWRKYGQKVTQNTKHPRNYYRCTHKIGKGCEARKQVQQTKDNPPMFITTYHGRHTCRNNPIQKSTHLEDNTSVLISFGSTCNPNTDPLEPYFQAISFTNQQEKKPSWDHRQNETSSPSQLNNGSGIVTTALESFGSPAAMHWSADNGDRTSSEVYSSRAGSNYNQGLCMDITVEDVEFDDLFGLGLSDLLGLGFE
ncbi:probable WRKY transcription factor 70 [Diospyros lotus]|uniref:probable WRKY transcription factor 70 n=1 Tax=Diospyros lotus TaxID=55363 RepID=UPI0022579D97|nr:probable WRKY transcription factor 70 [Diospyros lotus]